MVLVRHLLHCQHFDSFFLQNLVDLACVMDLSHDDNHLLEAVVEHEVEVRPDIGVLLDVLSLLGDVHAVERDHLELVHAHDQMQMRALPQRLAVKLVVFLVVWSEVALVYDIRGVLKWGAKLKLVFKNAHLHICDLL